MTRATAAARSLCGVALLVAALAAGSAAGSDDDPRRIAPYAATDDAVTEAMLDLARVAASDHVVDLGSGDGRIVLAAARRGASGVGVEIDARLVAIAQARAAHERLAERARFVQQDLFEADLSQATVVTLYLFPAAMARVADKLAASLAPGTRVVSHDFPLPGWPAVRVAVVDAPGKRDAIGTQTATLYLYATPSRDPAARAPR